MIIVQSWFGRLGNNIIQLSNIIDIALVYKHNIIFNVNHRLFNLNIITDYFIKYNNDELITDEYNFYYKSKLPYSKKIFEQNIEERDKIIQEAF
tara:strand:+ start:2105 stop:2386 length:282 start_codon:yes stop_codon:yes gene_type:complete